MAAATGVGADGVRSRYYTGIGSNGYNGWFYVYDPQGNTVQRTTDFWNRDTGLLFYDTSLYDSYGILLRAAWTGGNQNSPHRDAVGFGGQFGYYTDYDTTLLCLTHRYYDPATGRFVNRDPIGYDGGINLYTFADGNPVNNIDPMGTDAGWARSKIPNDPYGERAAQEQTLMTLFGAGGDGAPDYGMGDDSANAAYLHAVTTANSSSFGMGGRRGGGRVRGTRAPSSYKPGYYDHLQDPPTVGPGKRFTTKQIEKIYAENMKRNGGVLRDDVTGEALVRSRRHEKGIPPPANSAQVDHVNPRRPAPGMAPGTNSYKNAAVRSMTNNRAKSNKE